MNLNDLIKWARENNMDFHAPIMVGDTITGTSLLDSKMIDLDYQDKTHGCIYLEPDGNNSH